jgi:hypothetical protein
MPVTPISSVGAKRAESGGKERQIRRPFHPDYYFPRKRSSSKRQHWSTRPHTPPILPKSHFPLWCKLQILGLLTRLRKAFNSYSPCISQKRTAVPSRNPASTARPVRPQGLLSPLDRSRKPSRIRFPSYMFPILAVAPILVAVLPKFILSE